jgi:hypothetical protein
VVQEVTKEGQVALLQTRNWKNMTWGIASTMGLADDEPRDAPDTLPSDYEIPSEPPKRLKDVVMELAEVYHKQQLHTLQQAFEVLDFFLSFHILICSLSH